MKVPHQLTASTIKLSAFQPARWLWTYLNTMGRSLPKMVRTSILQKCICGKFRMTCSPALFGRFFSLLLNTSSMLNWQLPVFILFLCFSIFWITQSIFCVIFHASVSSKFSPFHVCLIWHYLPPLSANLTPSSPTLCTTNTTISPHLHQVSLYYSCPCCFHWLLPDDDAVHRNVFRTRSKSFPPVSLLFIRNLKFLVVVYAQQAQPARQAVGLPPSPESVHPFSLIWLQHSTASWKSMPRFYEQQCQGRGSEQHAIAAIWYQQPFSSRQSQHSTLDNARASHAQFKPEFSEF